MRMKRILAAALAATMVMASALTASAATTTAGTGTSGSGTVSGGSGSSESSSESSSQPSAAQVYMDKASVKADATMEIAGLKVKTSVAGIYAAYSVDGCAVTTPFADVVLALGLKPGQTPKMVAYDTDMEKSYRAMASVNAAASALNATVVTAINVDLGAMQNNKWVELKDGSIAMMVGLPKTADLTKTYAVVCVQPGGATTIYEDVDTNPASVTFQVNAGLGTYAIVAY